ncbi:MAG: hypothetical protein VYC39_06950 [Myxococcota bacterium]|nr:hypothetical protein [Myxococcota bacterium]
MGSIVRAMQSIRYYVGLITFLALFSCDAATDDRRVARRGNSSTPDTGVEVVADAGFALDASQNSPMDASSAPQDAGNMMNPADAGASTECVGDPAFTGQIGGTEVPNGGTAVFTPYPRDYNAGIENLISAIPQMHDETADVDIMITNATVVATSHRGNSDIPRFKTNFWVADGKGIIEVRLYYPEITEDEYPSFEVRTGQKISFRVTKVQRYYEKGQVQQATDWELEDSNQPVYIWEPDRELTTSDVPRLVRVTGRLEGEGADCGRTSRCWELDYGRGAPVTFRTSSNIVGTGSCVTFVGPLESYNSSVKFNVVSFSWVKIYN